MRAIKKLWGLLYDDARLVVTLVVALLLSLLLKLLNLPTIAAIVIWLGLVVSLWISIEHELSLKRSSKRSS